MLYKSTRGMVKGIKLKDAVMMGLAEDGGLLIPESIPFVDAQKLNAFRNLSYQQLAFEIISLFVDDIPSDDLRTLIDKSYSTFDTPEVIPLVEKGGIFIAEIFHGPTFAFKDIALQFLGNLFEYILKQTGEKLNIIGATSGDTGSAAIQGVRGKENINIFILHPKGKVSPVQELQMTTVTDKNVFNLAVDGNFDDCQFIVKEIFNDIEFKKSYKLGAINSINWARILTQIVYYFHSYLKVASEGESVNIAVPTGNFGNIFAGFLAKMMGLPINKLILATNENNILSRFVDSGDYSLKDVMETYSPSMDIQLASNFERYLYYLYNSPEKVCDKMQFLRENRYLKFDEEDLQNIHKDLMSHSVSNEDTLRIIRDFYNETGYILDPHTSCGIGAIKNLSPKGKNICLSTAHPAKFYDAIVKAVNINPHEPEAITKLKNLPKKFQTVPFDVSEVKKFIQEKLD